MTPRRHFVRALVLVFATTSTITEAQSGQDTVELLKMARESTRRFHDVRAASDAGFRPIGPHSPSMGEHWVNVALLLAKEPRVDQPAILNYLVVDTGRVLVGVTYAAYAPRGVVPPNAIAPARLWHIHAGNLDDEGFFTEHDPAADSHGESAHESGVAVLHLWAWVANPDGVFAANNWALPYISAGLPLSQYHSRDAARAVALATGGRGFIHEQMRRVASLDTALAAVLGSELDRVSGEAEGILRAPPQNATASTGGRLAESWRTLRTRLYGRLTDGARTRLNAVFFDLLPQPATRPRIAGTLTRTRQTCIVP